MQRKNDIVTAYQKCSVLTDREFFNFTQPRATIWVAKFPMHALANPDFIWNLIARSEEERFKMKFHLYFKRIYVCVGEWGLM